MIRRCNTCASELFQLRHCELCETTKALRALVEGLSGDDRRMFVRRLRLSRQMYRARELLRIYDERYGGKTGDGKEEERDSGAGI